MYKNELKTARIAELEAQLAAITKQKGRKRKRLQTGGTLEFSVAADQVAAEASITVKKPRKGSGSNSQDQAPTTQRRCGKCGKTGHNVRTCQLDREPSPESVASTQYIFSDTSCSNNDDYVD